MIDLTETSAAGIKFLDFHRLVFLAVVRADEPTDGETPQYFGSREFVLNSKTYADLMAGLTFEWMELGLKAGLSPVANVSLVLRNEGKLAKTLNDQFFLENDDVEFYVLYVAAGGNDDADRIPIGRGVIDDYPSDVHEWSINVVDASDKDWIDIPSRLVEPTDYIYAPLDAMGKPLPFPFGNLNIGPYDDAGTTRFLAPCRCTDLFAQQYTAGLHNKSATTTFQFYRQQNRLAEVIDTTDAGAFVTLDTPARKLLNRPDRPASTNNVTDWYLTADGKTSTSVTVRPTDALDVYFAGVAKLGTLTACTIEIKAAGTFDYTVKLGVATLTSGTDSNDSSISLAAYLTNWDEDWDFQTLQILISSATSPTIKRIEQDIRYDDHSGIDAQNGLEIYRKVEGFQDNPAKYNGDGATNPNIVSVPTSVAAVLAAGGSLTVSTTYYYVVTAIDEAGVESTISTEVSETPTAGGIQTIDLCWDAKPWAVSYKVYRSTTSGSYVTPALAGNPTSNSFSDTGVTLQTGAPPAAGPVLTNPVDVLQAKLRVKDLLNRSTDDLNLASFEMARGKRALWKYAFTLLETWREIERLNPFLQEAGLHLFQNTAGKWTVVARDELAEPQHTFLDQWNIAVVDAEAELTDQEPALDIGRVKNRDLVNEFVVRAQKDRTTGEHNLLEIASSAFRITGTCSLAASTGRINAPGETFISDDVDVGWIFYIDTDQAYKVTEVVGEEDVDVVPVEGTEVQDALAGTTFWAGTNLDPDVLRSRRRYKTLNPMGRPSVDLRDIGGYESDFIADTATLKLQVTHWRDWHGQIHLVVTLFTFAGHIDVETGDLCWFDHPNLETKKRPLLLTNLDGGITAGATTFKVTDNEVELIRDDDYLLLRDNPRQPEITKVSSFDPVTDIVTVQRGMCGTQAAAHGDNAAVERITTKWEAIGYRPPQPDDTRIGVRLLETPNSYFPVVIIAPDGTPDWSGMTDYEKSRYRAIAYNSGLIEERDLNSLAVIGAD